jgi:DNA-binding CsgD family transcriptional regulator
MEAPVLNCSFQDRLPLKPYCSNNPQEEGLKILPLAYALGKKYIQVNPPCMKSFLLFDIDRAGAALAAEDADLPAPTFTVVNPANRHAHLLYALEAPVCTSEAGRDGPKRFCKAVEGAYRDRLGADMGFAGLIVKNPWHEAWLTIENGNAVYQLSELADYVEFSPTRKRENPMGRNCTLFDTLRYWAYDSIHEYWKVDGRGAWEEALLQKARFFNDFPDALPAQEVKHIARSVARWTWRNITPSGSGLPEFIRKTHTPEAQRARVKKRWKKADATEKSEAQRARVGKRWEKADATEKSEAQRARVGKRWEKADATEKSEAQRARVGKRWEKADATEKSEAQRARVGKRWEKADATEKAEAQRVRIGKRWEKESKKEQGLRLKSQGKSNKEIAQVLQVSERTVSNWSLGKIS